MQTVRGDLTRRTRWGGESLRSLRWPILYVVFRGPRPGSIVDNVPFGEACRNLLGGLSVGILGASCGLLGESWGPLGPPGGKGSKWQFRFPSWGASSWAVLGRSWAVLGLSWAILGPSWEPLGLSWGDLGGLLGRLGQRKHEKAITLKLFKNRTKIIEF